MLKVSQPRQDRRGTASSRKDQRLEVKVADLVKGRGASGYKKTRKWWSSSPREEQEKTSTRKRRKMRILGQEGTGNPEHAKKKYRDMNISKRK